jgi:hypothetical protein
MEGPGLAVAAPAARIRVSAHNIIPDDRGFIANSFTVIITNARVEHQLPGAARLEMTRNSVEESVYAVWGEPEK